MNHTEFTYAGTELDALAEVRNYYAWLLTHFAPHLGNNIVEVGAGIGTFSEFLLQATDAKLTLIEPADNNYPILAQRFAAEDRVNLFHGYLEDVAPTLAADSLVAVNVLEHIPDDLGFLRAAYRALEPGGALLLFVPALPELFGTLDVAFDHFRRYRKSTLRSALEQAGFRDVRLRYLNLPGVLTWFMAGRVFRRSTLAPRDVRLYDRWVIPIVSRFESRWEPPLGQSLLAVGVK